ncbi:MAG TPA: replicative DNA helicase, partial [Terriglobales bacterium]|nr:replicative DNA helicase [Terriglobales bacterium]
NLDDINKELMGSVVKAEQHSPTKVEIPHTDAPAALPSEDLNRRSLEKHKRKMSAQSSHKAPDLNQSPPFSVDSEKALLGSMILDQRATIAEVVAQAKPEWFYVPAHVIIYNELVKMWDKGQPIDLVTFTEHLKKVGHSQEVGGPPYVTEIFAFVPSAANYQMYLDEVRDKFLLRQVISAGSEAIQRAYKEQEDVRGLLDDLEQKFINLGDDRYVDTVLSMKDNAMKAIDVIESLYARKGSVTGVATGFSQLDRITGGLQASDMIVIAARPSMGKTALCMNIAEHVAVNSKLPVGVFSLEMSVEQVTQRLICARARVNLERVRSGFLTERDFPLITAAAAKLAEALLFIDDAHGLTILELKARARRLKARYGIRLLVVDYLQLLRSNSRRGQENRQIEVTEISAGLKGLAKELKIPIIVAAQLNRQPEARQGGKPRLSDLRESGSIEQDADVVGLLYRPEVYEDDRDARIECAGEAELIIAKHRNGQVGEIPLTFLKEYTRFEDRAREVAS